jgi:cytoskeleton protein RodZ
MNDALPVTEHLSPGRTLAAAREALKLSVADVSQQIKYGVKQIAAIEADDYAKLPGTTFVRGMIRSYAKLLHVDAEPLLADLGRRDIPAPVTVDLRTKGQEPFIEGGEKSNRIYVLLSVVALAAVAVVAYEWQVGAPDKGEVVTIAPKAAPGDASPPAPADASVATAAPAGAQPSVGAGDAQAARAARTPPAVVIRGGTSGLQRMELEFDALSWVEVKQADGKVLLSQLNQPGSRQVIDGTAPLDVVIGNAAKVRLKYNDAPVDLRPYFKVDVARLKLE